MHPIDQLKAAVSDSPYDAYLIPGTDPHQSEYPIPRWQCRKHFTAFTGSLAM